MHLDAVVIVEDGQRIYLACDCVTEWVLAAGSSPIRSQVSILPSPFARVPKGAAKGPQAHPEREFIFALIATIFIHEPNVR